MVISSSYQMAESEASGSGLLKKTRTENWVYDSDGKCIEHQIVEKSVPTVSRLNVMQRSWNRTKTNMLRSIRQEPTSMLRLIPQEPTSEERSVDDAPKALLCDEETESNHGRSLKHLLGCAGGDSDHSNACCKKVLIPKESRKSLVKLLSTKCKNTFRYSRLKTSLDDGKEEEITSPFEPLCCSSRDSKLGESFVTQSTLEHGKDSNPRKNSSTYEKIRNSKKCDVTIDLTRIKDLDWNAFQSLIKESDLSSYQYQCSTTDSETFKLPETIIVSGKVEVIERFKDMIKDLSSKQGHTPVEQIKTESEEKHCADILEVVEPNTMRSVSASHCYDDTKNLMMNDPRIRAQVSELKTVAGTLLNEGLKRWSTTGITREELSLIETLQNLLDNKCSKGVDDQEHNVISNSSIPEPESNVEAGDTSTPLGKSSWVVKESSGAASDSMFANINDSDTGLDTESMSSGSLDSALHSHSFTSPNGAAFCNGCWDASSVSITGKDCQRRGTSVSENIENNTGSKTSYSSEFLDTTLLVKDTGRATGASQLEGVTPSTMISDEYLTAQEPNILSSHLEVNFQSEMICDLAHLDGQWVVNFFTESEVNDLSKMSSADKDADEFSRRARDNVIRVSGRHFEFSVNEDSKESRLSTAIDWVE